MESTQTSQADLTVAGWPASVKLRTLIGTGLVVLFVLLLAVDSAWPAGFLYAGIGTAMVAVALDEAARMARRLGVDVQRPLLVLGGSALFLAHWAGMASPAAPDGWLLALALLALVVLVQLSESVVRARIEGALLTLSVTAGMLVYVPVLLGFLTAVRVQFGTAGLVTVAAVCKAGSTGAYFVGTALGRHKLAPRVSPKKTVEGALGAVLACMLVACLLSRSPWGLMNGWLALLYGAVVAAAGMLGDLAASLLKRETGVKDSGRLLPGTGGMLDILDDVLFVAPVSFLFFWGARALASGV